MTAMPTHPGQRRGPGGGRTPLRGPQSRGPQPRSPQARGMQGRTGGPAQMDSDGEFEYEYAYVKAYRGKSPVPLIMGIVAGIVLIAGLIGLVYLLAHPEIFNPAIASNTNTALESDDPAKVGKAVQYLIAQDSYRSLLRVKERYIKVIRDEGPANYFEWQTQVGEPLLAYLKENNNYEASEMKPYVLGGGGGRSKTQIRRTGDLEAARDALEDMISLVTYEYFVDNILDYLRSDPNPEGHPPAKIEALLREGLDFEVVAKWDGTTHEFVQTPNGGQRIKLPLSLNYYPESMREIKQHTHVYVDRRTDGSFYVNWSR